MHNAMRKFGTMSVTFGVDLHAKFHHNRNRLTNRHIPCMILTNFQDYGQPYAGSRVKIWRDSIKKFQPELGPTGGVEFESARSPRFLTPSGSETASDLRTFSRWKNVLEVVYHHAEFSGTRTSRVAGEAKMSFFRLSVVTLSNSKHARIQGGAHRARAPPPFSLEGIFLTLVKLVQLLIRHLTSV